MRPHIEIKSTPINRTLSYANGGDQVDEQELFHVFVAEDRLKLLFTVEWVDPALNPREFKVVKHNQLYLDGMDRKAAYPSGQPTDRISADPSIVNFIFQDNLGTYGIVVNKLTVHNMVFFESSDFVFTDQEKLGKLYDLINEACKKVKHHPSDLG